MRLLLFFPSLGRGGVEEQALVLAAAGRRAGHEVVTVFPRNPGTASVLDDVRAAGFDMVEWPLGAVVDGQNRYGTPAEQAAEMTRMLDRVRPDAVMIMVPWPDTSTGVMAACAAAAVPTLAIFCLVRDLPMTIPPPMRAVAAAIRGRNQRWTAISEDNRTLLAKLYGVERPDEIALVHNGVDLPEEWVDPDESAVAKVRAALRTEVGIPQTARVVLTVSRLSRGKGHQDLLNAVAQLPPEYADTHFVWAGAGELAEKLRASAEELGIADRVHQLGYRRDVAALLHAADLFVFPSHGEGCARVLIEAMAAGLPIVCANGSSNPEIVVDDEHGLHYLVGDPASLARRLRQALDDPGWMRVLAGAARRRAREVFPERAMNDGTYQLLDEVVARPRPEPDPSLLQALSTAG